jgi:hypothetical protein
MKLGKIVFQIIYITKSVKETPLPPNPLPPLYGKLEFLYIY